MLEISNDPMLQNSSSNFAVVKESSTKASDISVKHFKQQHYNCTTDTCQLRRDHQSDIRQHDPSRYDQKNDNQHSHQNNLSIRHHSIQCFGQNPRHHQSYQHGWNQIELPKVTLQYKGCLDQQAVTGSVKHSPSTPLMVKNGATRRPPTRDASVSQRYEFADPENSDMTYYLEVTLTEDQTTVEPSLALRVTTNYGLDDSINWDDTKILHNVSGRILHSSGVWASRSTSSLKGNCSKSLIPNLRELANETRVYLHWGLGHDDIHGWELPKCLPENSLITDHQVSDDCSAVRSIFRSLITDPSSRCSTRNRSSAQISDQLSTSSEGFLSRQSFSRNLSHYALVQSALKNVECRDLYYQRLAINGRNSTDELRRKLIPKSMEVLIPLGPIVYSPKSFQFVLHDTKRKLWIHPDAKLVSHQDPIFHVSSSGLKVFSPALWREPSMLNGNFFFPIYRAVRILTLLRFRELVGAMRPPPSIYRQFDLRPNFDATIDVGIWPAVEAYCDEQSSRGDGSGTRPDSSSLVLVELITNLDNQYVNNEDILLHWGIIQPLQTNRPGVGTNFCRYVPPLDWEFPELCSWPPNITEVFRSSGRLGAAQSALQSGVLYGPEFSILSRTRMSFPMSQLPFGIAFVLTNTSQNKWIKYKGEDFIVMFSGELKAGLSRHPLVIPSPAASLFSTQPMSRINPGDNDVKITDSGIDNSPCDEINIAASAVTLASRLRRNVFAAGAAVALKMAQSGQLRELTSAAAGRRLSSAGKNGSSSPFRVDSEGLHRARDFDSGARGDNLSSGIGSGDDEGDAVNRITQPWVCFAGKKVLLSRSSFRRTHDIIVPGIGNITTQFGSFHNERGNVTLIVACRSPVPLVLHWAFANMNTRAGSPWLIPAKYFWPSSTIISDTCAVETLLRRSNNDDGLWTFELVVPLYVALRTQSPHQWGPTLKPQSLETEYKSSVLSQNGISNDHFRARSEYRSQSSSSSSLRSHTIAILSPVKGRLIRRWELLSIAWGFQPAENLERPKHDRAEDCNGIFFVLTDIDHKFWIRDGSNDFHLPLRRIDYSLTSRFGWSSSERRLLETILTAELTYSTWGVRGRYELLRYLLQDDDYDKSDTNFWSWIFVWFSFFTPTYHSRYRRRGGYITHLRDGIVLADRETFLELSSRSHRRSTHPPLQAPLIFQRGAFFQPIALAEQADQLSLLLTSYWRNYAEQRIFIRLILSRVILPTAAANLISRVEHVLSRWHFNLQPFFKTWLEKMKTSCGPEDLVICRAIISFLKTGLLKDFWDVLNYYSIDLSTLCDQHPILGYPIYPFGSPNDPPFSAPVLMEVNALSGEIIQPYQTKTRIASPLETLKSCLEDQSREQINVLARPMRYRLSCIESSSAEGQGSNIISEVCSGPSEENQPLSTQLSVSHSTKDLIGSSSIRMVQDSIVNTTSFVSQYSSDEKVSATEFPIHLSPSAWTAAAAGGNGTYSYSTDDVQSCAGDLLVTATRTKGSLKRPTLKTETSTTCNNELNPTSLILSNKTAVTSLGSSSILEDQNVTTIASEVSVPRGSNHSVIEQNIQQHYIVDQNLTRSQTSDLKSTPPSTTVTTHSDENTIWIVQFYPLQQKTSMIRDFLRCEHFLEALFEGVSLSASAYAARRSLRSDIREALSEVLSTSDPSTDVHFFNVANARHILFPIIQHCTDNQTLRDCMYLDIALEQLQSDLTLGFLSTAFQSFSPNSCERKNDPLEGRSRDDFPSELAMNFYGDLIQRCHSNRQLQAPRHTESPQNIFFFDECGATIDGTFAAASPAPSASAMNLSPRKLLDSPLFSTSGLLINPIYLLKEMLACLVVSLLAMQIKFSELDEIHSDMCALLIQPMPTSKWGYGFPVFESMAKLREKTLLNASVEHTQFARGFYYTQAQRKTSKKSRHLPSPSGPATSPFVIPSVISFIPNLTPLTSLDPSAQDAPTDCTHDVDSATFPPPIYNRPKHSRSRLASDTSSLLSSSQQTSFRQNSGISSFRQNSGITSLSATSQSGFPPHNATSPIAPTSTRINPTSMTLLASRLVETSFLRKQARDDDRFRTALLCMSSIVERLQGVVDTILSTLQTTLEPKAQQLSASRSIFTAPGFFPDGLYRRQQQRLNDLKESREIQVNSGWNADSHVLEKIYFESPCNPISHLLDVIENVLSSVLEPRPPIWKIFGKSVYRRMGVLRWSETLSSPDIYVTAHTPTILVVRHVLGYEDIPDDICAILFLGRPSTKDAFEINNELRFPLTPCHFSPLALHARKKNVLLAACLVPEIFIGLYLSRPQWEGMLAEVVVDSSKRNIRLRLDPLNPERSNINLISSCCPDTDIDPWPTIPTQQIWHCPSDVIDSPLHQSSFIIDNEPTKSVTATSLRSIKNRGNYPDFIMRLRGTVEGLVLLNLIEMFRYPSPPVTVLPPLYGYIIGAGTQETYFSKKAQENLNSEGSTWLVEVEDFWREGMSSEAIAFKDLNSCFELSEVLSPTIAVPFNGFDRALYSPENLQNASRLARYCLELEALGDARFCEAKNRANSLLRKCRSLVLELAPPLSFLLEFQEDQKVAAICRGSKKSSVLRKISDSGAMELWRALLVVWSGMFTMPTHLAAVASGMLPASLRVSVLIHDLRSAEYSFTLHCNIPLQALKQRETLSSQFTTSLRCDLDCLGFPEFSQTPSFTLDSCYSESTPVVPNGDVRSLDHGSRTSSSASVTNLPPVEPVLPLERKQSQLEDERTLCPPMWSQLQFRDQTNAEDLQIQNKHLTNITQYWDSTCRTPLNDLSAYNCPFSSTTPTTVLYGEIASGLRLRRSEILPNGRTLNGSPYGFVACQSCTTCASRQMADNEGYDNKQSDESPQLHRTSARIRAMTNFELWYPKDPHETETAELKKFRAMHRAPSLQSDAISRPSKYLPNITDPFLLSPVSSSQMYSRASVPRVRSLSRPRRPSLIFGEVELNATTQRRASNFELPVSPRRRNVSISNSQHRPGRQTLCMPGRTWSVKFRKSGLLFRGCLNLDLLSDVIPGGALVAVTSNLKYGTPRNKVEPLILSSTWRERLTDRLILLQRAVLSEVAHPNDPWIIEGVVSSNSELSIVSCRRIQSQDHLNNRAELQQNNSVLSFQNTKFGSSHF